MTDGGLYIQLISLHGLVRSTDMELGRDADTGGQIKYVVELAKALAEHPGVDRVDLLTRQVFDSKISQDYAQPEEDISPGVKIIRLPFGPKRYLRKEVLWPYLDTFVDQALKHIRKIGRVPDLVHSHYADAGYAGAKIANLLEVPLAHTGHSLGRDKLRRLLDKGMKQESIEHDYRISTRIDAEETALDNAAFVVASTNQEVNDQYSYYDNYNPDRMVVIPPGVDLDRFYPPKSSWFRPPIFEELDRFLSQPRKPMILAMSRPDHRKNIASLIHAYGQSDRLQEIANLVVIVGNRDDIQAMEKGPQEVLSELLYLFDKYNLYGKAAYPKHHQADDVPLIYRLAAKSKGVFINPALTEPFGLTLIEAAASGLPVVATEDGGPRDIIGHCKNGILINPLDIDAIQQALLNVLEDRIAWAKRSKSGTKGAHRYFSWGGHVKIYLKTVKKVLKKSSTKRTIAKRRTTRLPLSDRVLVCDVDNTLVGDSESLEVLMNRLKEGSEKRISYGIATGRYIESTIKTLKEWHVPMPDFFITSVGSEIYYNGSTRLIADTSWGRHINYRWEPDRARMVMMAFEGVKLQSKEEQRTYKISYFYDPKKAPPVAEIRKELRKNNLHVNVVYSHGMYIDILPMRASKGLAVRYLASKWGFPAERILVAGDAGSDEDMLSGETLGIVVANHSPELEKLRGRERIFFADKEYAAGILQGIEHYDFYGAMKASGLPGDNDDGNA